MKKLQFIRLCKLFEELSKVNNKIAYHPDTKRIMIIDPGNHMDTVFSIVDYSAELSKGISINTSKGFYGIHNYLKNVYKEYYYSHFEWINLGNNNFVHILNFRNSVDIILRDIAIYYKCSSNSISEDDVYFFTSFLNFLIKHKPA